MELRGSRAELLLRALPLVIMAAVATCYAWFGPGWGILPLLAVGPAFAALTAGLRYTLLVGIVALVLCAVLSVFLHHLSMERDVVAFGTVAGATAASLIATEVRRRREQELTDVRAIADAAQRVLLRPVPPQAGPVRLAVRYMSAASGARIGGDLYEVAVTATGLRLIIGDVQGKGLTAVQLTETVLGTFRETAFEAASLAAIARRIENSLARSLTDEQFVTAILAETRWPDPELTVLNCGHPAPLLMAGGWCRPAGTAAGGLPLGLTGLGGPGRKPSQVAFGPGEAVLLYTDGISEARDRSGEFFPLERYCETLGALDPDAALDRLCAEVLSHVGHPLDDDAALLLLARDPWPPGAPPPGPLDLYLAACTAFACTALSPGRGPRTPGRGGVMTAVGQNPPGRPRPPGPADPVLSSGEIARLLRTQAPDSSLMSVYLTVPLDPAERRGLPARLDDLLRSARDAPAAGGALPRARRLQLPVVKDVVSARAADWLGRSVAIFACPELNLLEAIPLRGQVAERAMVGTRPYVRPLLADLRRSPSYLAVVVDRRRAWLWRVSGNGIEARGSVQGDTVASRRFGGWHGLAAYRNEQRARGLVRKHYAQTVSALTGALGGCGPVAVGGQEAETAAFRAVLPPALAGRLAGTFVIDPHTMTPARVRQLADGVVSRWEGAREAGLAAEVAGLT
ncbi:MAG: SpoIIE family protein phosphatase, partial [Nocardiopsaceae bacterium]|nr:SpoIIE family protein phosphatase [Nocardiopsaceae bacterium]